MKLLSIFLSTLLFSSCATQIYTKVGKTQKICSFEKGSLSLFDVPLKYKLSKKKSSKIYKLHKIGINVYTVSKSKKAKYIINSFPNDSLNILSSQTNGPRYYATDSVIYKGNICFFKNEAYGSFNNKIPTDVVNRYCYIYIFTTDSIIRRSVEFNGAFVNMVEIIKNGDYSDLFSVKLVNESPLFKVTQEWVSKELPTGLIIKF